MVKGKIAGIPSGTSHTFNMLLTKFKLDLVMILICMSKCEET